MCLSNIKKSLIRILDLINADPDVPALVNAGIEALNFKVPIFSVVTSFDDLDINFLLQDCRQEKRATEV